MQQFNEKSKTNQFDLLSEDIQLVTYFKFSVVVIDSLRVDPMSATAPLINPLLASVVGLVVIIAVVVVVVGAIAKYCIRRRRRSKVTRFGK